MDKDGQTALHLACLNGRKDDIKTLISAGADVNKLSREGNSPLMLLAGSESDCRYECMKVLIESGANVKITTREGKQAIHSVIFSGDIKCVKLLLDNGADSSAVLVSNKKSLLHFAALKNQAEIARYLLEHKADLSARDELLMTPVMVAAIKHSVEVLRILLDAGTDVTKKAQNGMTALHIAALAKDERSTETVCLLCEAGVPMDSKDERGMCAIHCHLDFQRNANVKTLLDNGCDADLRCNAGFTPLMRICSACNSDTDKDGQLELIKILLRGGAEVNAASENGNTALSYACRKNNWGAVRVLLDAESDVNVRDKQGDTPLHEAAMANQPEIARLLLDAGANGNVNNAQGETALLLSAKQGYVKVVTEFFGDGSAISEENSIAARDMAARNGYHDVVAAIPIAVPSGEGSIDN